MGRIRFKAEAEVTCCRCWDTCWAEATVNLEEEIELDSIPTTINIAYNEITNPNGWTKVHEPHYASSAQFLCVTCTQQARLEEEKEEKLKKRRQAAYMRKKEKLKENS